MRRKIFVVALGVFLLALALLLFREPRTDGVWAEHQMRIPKITLANGQLSIEGVRDFQYESGGRVIQARYLHKRYDIAQLKQVWFGLSHFSDNGFAHAFLSFEFGDSEFLVSSIEARLERGQEYDPLKGLLNFYPRIMILGTERDVIGLRSHYRKERVLLYPLKLNRERVQGLFMAIMNDAMRIYQEADFYNTLSDNCLSGIIRYEKIWSNFFKRLDYRLIFPGYSDELVYQYHLFDAQGSLPALRSRALIEVDQVEISDKAFSHKIREKWLSERSFE